jgi:hypothetical protein
MGRKSDSWEFTGEADAENRKNAMGRKSGQGRGITGRTEVGLEEPLRVLLHVAAVDGRHGERPARARPAPTLPRQGLGFWRSAPEGLRELAEERRAERRSAGAVAGGAGSVPPTRMAPPCWGGGGVSLALASEPRVWGEGRDGSTGRTRRKTRAMGLELMRGEWRLPVWVGLSRVNSATGVWVRDAVGP